MTHKNCLNCEEKLTGKYCSGCGQKTDTHRISFKNFLVHDILHGTFHIDRGILFTAKQALLRPGKAALDYISGKRKSYYNVFYLVLVTFGLMSFVWHFYGELVVGQGRIFVSDHTDPNEASRRINEIIREKRTFFLFLFVPLAAISSFILFRKKKLNLTEHAILSGLVLVGILMFSTVGNLLYYFDLVSEFNDFVASSITTSTISICFLYVGFAYVNAFGSDYNRKGIALRIVLFFAIFALEVWILLYLLIGYVTDWKMGTVTIRPFG